MASERRLRQNFQHGTITDNPLTAASLSINSPEFADLVAVGGTEHLILVLDPKGINGDPEIVTVVAHTAATTTVTVGTRGAEGDNPAREHPQGTTWILAPTRYDYKGIFTSATRPVSNIYEGQNIYETDTDRTVVYTGTEWRLDHNPPACRVFHSVDQSLADATITAIAFNSERYDTDTMHDTAVFNTRITFKTPGVYVVTASLAFTGATDYTSLFLGIRLNGLTYIAQASAPGANDSGLNVIALIQSTQYKFAVNDYVEVLAWHNNTANAARNVLSSANHSPEFSATWVGVG